MIKTVYKIWGREEWIANSPAYCGKRLSLYRGYQCSLHMHPIKAETFFVERGRVLMQLGEVETVLSAGDSVYIPPKTWHRFGGLHDSLIFEFSTTHDDNDVVRKEDSKQMADIMRFA